MTERLRELLREAATEPEPLRPQDIAHRLRHRRRVRAGVATVFAATAIAAIVVPLTAVHTDDHRAEVVVAGPSTSTNSLNSNGFSIPASITVSGTSIPYAGDIPWADAVTPTSDSTTLTIYADIGEPPSGTCGYDGERVEVHEDANTVGVLVAGYARPEPDVACTLVRLGAKPLSVQLTRPLGNRHLVDGYDQNRHTALVAATVPTLGTVPSGYQQQPVRWDERSGGACTRSWARVTPGPSALPSTITLTRTPQALVQPSERDGSGTLVATGISVATGPPHGTARVWNHVYAGGQFVTVLWTGADGFAYQLYTATPPGSSLGVAQVEALARSVH